MAKKQKKNDIVLPQSYYVFSVDGSLDRPGFAVFYYDNGKIKNIQLSNVNNKHKTKQHGHKLNDILLHMKQLCQQVKNENVVFVREHAVGGKFHNDTAIYEQVGMLNWYLWKTSGGNCEWHQIYPVTVKKQITGNGRATKDEVRSCLKYYIGQLEYECDDESDALAIGLSFLIMNNQIKGLEIKEN